MPPQTAGLPSDFPLYKITAPISIHHSMADTVSDPTDVNTLITKLVSTEELFVQTIRDEFKHIDFAWGMNAAGIVYSNITNFFANY